MPQNRKRNRNCFLGACKCNGKTFFLINDDIFSLVFYATHLIGHHSNFSIIVADGNINHVADFLGIIFFLIA